MDPIFSILRQKCIFYRFPSTNLTVDEIMLKFEGRTTQKITIPGKPIPTKFKIFALGDSGYTYNWECTRPGLTEGVSTEKKRISVNIPNSSIATFLNPTQSVVIRLISCLSVYIQNRHSLHLFLDNICLLEICNGLKRVWNCCYWNSSKRSFWISPRAFYNLKR